MRYLLALFTLLPLVSALAAPNGDPAKGKVLAEKICVACHGVDGNSVISTNPVLAGQHSDYLYKQLSEFKASKRKNPVMFGIATTLSDTDMANAAAWFSSQQPKEQGASDKALIEAGRAIYRGGIAAKGLPACMSCHSPDGAGIPAQFPRLAGQHAAYIRAQLTAFRAGDRANSAIMMPIAEKMTDKEIKAVAEFIQALH
ncbi:MAG: c-type cytochrome [Formivibrio sp.]|nr:c-type cytochrome [Formivibrio sp.]